MMMKPALRPPMLAPLRSANSPREGGGVLNALSPLKAKLAGETGDAAVLFIGDSTSSTDARIAKPLATYLAGLYPKFTVVYYPPDGAYGFTAPVTIQTGTGARTLRVYNASVSGTLLQNFMAGRFTAAFITPGRNWDVLWFNVGKNHVAGATQYACEGEFLAGIAETQLKLELAAMPRPNIVVTDQYPNRDDANMDLGSTCWQDVVSAAPTITRLNLKTGATYVSGDFTDNAHLTDAAYLAKIDPQVQAFWAGTAPGVWTPAAPWLATAAPTNYLDGDSNEKFGDFNGDGTAGSVPGAAAGTPFGWTLVSGPVTFTKDATNKFSTNTRSQRAVAASGANQPRLTRTITTTKNNALKGKTAIFTAMMRIDTGGAASLGRISANIGGTGGAGNITSRSAAAAQGDFTVRCMGPFAVPSDAPAPTFTLYEDSAASPDLVNGLNWQWVSVAEGKLPRGV